MLSKFLQTEVHPVTVRLLDVCQSHHTQHYNLSSLVDRYHHKADPYDSAGRLTNLSRCGPDGWNQGAWIGSVDANLKRLSFIQTTTESSEE